MASNEEVRLLLLPCFLMDNKCYLVTYVCGILIYLLLPPCFLNVQPMEEIDEKANVSSEPASGLREVRIWLDISFASQSEPAHIDTILIDPRG